MTQHPARGHIRRILHTGLALLLAAATFGTFGVTAASADTVDDTSLDTTTQATPAAAAAYPTSLVNGDFQYLGNTIIDKRVAGTRYLTYMDPNKKQAMAKGPTDTWTTVTGFDKARFGWASDDNSVAGHTGIVELQRSATAKGGIGSKDNVWGEIVANQTGRAIHQDIDTTSATPVAYTVRLKHASRNSDHADGMQVRIGKPGHEQSVTMTRVTGNGLGDKTGVSSTTIRTNGTG